MFAQNQEVEVQTEIKTIKHALSIVGSLSRPSKMPGLAWGLSAKMCKRGKILAAVEGSTCSGCYALKGNYQYPGVKVAHERRLAGLCHPQWVEAMVFLLWWYDETYFRWMDSGDLQGEWHLTRIIEVCEALPYIKFWLPTRELGTIRAWKGSWPKNLVVRASGTMVDGPPPSGFTHTSTVISKVNKADWAAKVKSNTRANSYCPAPLQNGRCGSCRKCWSGGTNNDVAYLQH